MTVEDLAPFDWRRASVGLRHEPVTEEMMLEFDAGRACLTEYVDGVGAYIRCARLYDSLPLNDQGFLYVVEFGSTVVKVGQTINPRSRLMQHLRDANAFKTVITRFWISPAHWGFLHNEVDLIEYCAEVSSRAKREYFHDIGIGGAAIYAAELAHHSMSQEVKA